MYNRKLGDLEHQRQKDKDFQRKVNANLQNQLHDEHARNLNKLQTYRNALKDQMLDA